ncbi:MAG TPA: lysozyme inhibitor LprI family protein [Chitinophaga sp.]|uniref:lysozyme inhibitor LprI family protein n=1 Tax=Chitinophaga sp. TaxID=1869181 RepID=UPI002C976E63|nr:lysozyme inhibitor LprI family protein [Chitinophaga sp.]HVI46060.1 lysozyme inhibitor LprI family protein [Chitinophaga sp.]
MKSLFTVMLLITGSLTVFAQTQSDLNKKAAEEYKAADKELNNIYQQIMKDYTANKTFTGNLRDAQRLWVQFRDAQVKTMFPDPAKNYGSAFPMCKSNYLTELTHQRAEALRVWLNGMTQGDICSGSVGAKQ